MSKELFEITQRSKINIGSKVAVSRITVSSEDEIKDKYIELYMSLLGINGNKKIDLIKYLLSIRRKEDYSISGNYKYFSEQTKISLATVTSIVKELVKKNILTKILEANYVIDKSFCDILENPLPIIYIVEKNKSNYDIVEPETIDSFVN